MVDWKFMEVFRLVAGTSLEVDKKMYNKYHIKDLINFSLKWE